MIPVNDIPALYEQINHVLSVKTRARVCFSAYIACSPMHSCLQSGSHNTFNIGRPTLNLTPLNAQENSAHGSICQYAGSRCGTLWSSFEKKNLKISCLQVKITTIFAEKLKTDLTIRKSMKSCLSNHSLTSVIIPKKKWEQIQK